MTEPTLTVTIPGVPESVNHSHGHGRGRAWRTPETDSWLDDVIRLVRNKAVWHQGLRDSWRRRCGHEGCRVRIALTWYRPDDRQRDTSNIVKVLEDGIAHALEIDDRHFEWSTRSTVDRRDPRVELQLSLETGADA